MELGKSYFRKHIAFDTYSSSSRNVWVINRFITAHDLIPEFQDGND